MSLFAFLFVDIKFLPNLGLISSDMPKHKEKKKRWAPYGTKDEMATDVAPQSSRADESDPTSVSSSKMKPLSRGQLIQRQKQETRDLRDKIAKMNQEKLKLKDKGDRREMVRDIRKMQDDLAAAHVEELKKFDAPMVEKNANLDRVNHAPNFMNSYNLVWEKAFAKKDEMVDSSETKKVHPFLQAIQQMEATMPKVNWVYRYGFWLTLGTIKDNMFIICADLKFSTAPEKQSKWW